ncbi:MAG: hypothetical protein MUE67_08615 [Anaerolineales bacterium]|jgi:hypothetical protein|nr:hypothetical protein [Anaerolineales bacterium]
MNADLETTQTKKTWHPARLTYIGKVSEIVQQGGGKLSPPAADPGEPKKTRPSG